MTSEFLLRVVEIATGSSLGFMLGIIAFHYQQSRQSTKQEMDDWRAALDALNRLTTAAGANIEMLALIKLQLINDLRPDVDKMKVAIDGFFDASREERPKKIQELRAMSESLRHFYMSMARVSVMRPPDFNEYSRLSAEMPALTLYVHRAMGMMQELNDRIVSRNALIAGHAREGGTDTGMTTERLTYYSSMLAGEGECICEHTDFALDFWRLVLDQVNAYMSTKAKDEGLQEFQFPPAAQDAMPKNELFPHMREQLERFDEN